MTSVIIRRHLVRYFAPLSALHTIMLVTAWFCLDTGGGVGLEGMSQRLLRIFTPRHDDVRYAFWEIPDSKWALSQAK